MSNFGHFYHFKATQNLEVKEIRQNIADFYHDDGKMKIFPYQEL